MLRDGNWSITNFSHKTSKELQRNSRCLVSHAKTLKTTGLQDIYIKRNYDLDEKYDFEESIVEIVRKISFMNFKEFNVF